MSISKEEIISELVDFGGVNITLSNDYTYEISKAENWLCGGDGFISDLLGNVRYSSEESIVNAVFKFLEEISETVVEIN